MVALVSGDVLKLLFEHRTHCLVEDRERCLLTFCKIAVRKRTSNQSSQIAHDFLHFGLGEKRSSGHDVHRASFRPWCVATLRRRGPLHSAHPISKSARGSRRCSRSDGDPHPSTDGPGPSGTGISGTFWARGYPESTGSLATLRAASGHPDTAQVPDLLLIGPRMVRADRERLQGHWL